MLTLLILTALPSITESTETIEYWVRPDTMLECPQDIPQHQCVTITDLVVYSTNSSLNQGRNISIHFLPGVHTPRAEGRILIENEHWKTTNLTAIIAGEQNDEAKIQCSLAKVAFVFHHIFQSTLNNVKYDSCGYKTGVFVNTTIIKELPFIEFTSKLNKKIASLAIIKEASTQNHLFLRHVIIHNSSGYGLLVVHCCNDGDACMTSLSIVNITESTIQYSNVHQPQRVFSFFGRKPVCLGKIKTFSYCKQNESILQL